MAAKKSKVTESQSTDSILENLNKEFAGVLKSANEGSIEQVTNFIHSGSYSLDSATSWIGIPKDGKCTCIIGKESASKTTLALTIMANDLKQQSEKPVLFLDVEDSLDKKYARTLGVDLNRLHIVDRTAMLEHYGVDTVERKVVAAEEWLQFLSTMLQKNAHSVIVMDSVAALQPLSDITNGLQGGRLASIASVMSRAYKEIANSLPLFDGAFIYLNQFRMNPGNPQSPLSEPGGEAWKYLQNLKLKISKSLDKTSAGVVGIEVKGTVSKSKICPPYKDFSYYIQFGKGIIKQYDLVAMGVEAGIIKKAGAWYMCEALDNMRTQGEEAFVKQLLKDKTKEEKLLLLIKEQQQLKLQEELTTQLD